MDDDYFQLRISRQLQEERELRTPITHSQNEQPCKIAIVKPIGIEGNAIDDAKPSYRPRHDESYSKASIVPPSNKHNHSNFSASKDDDKNHHRETEELPIPWVYEDCRHPNETCGRETMDSGELTVDEVEGTFTHESNNSINTRANLNLKRSYFTGKIQGLTQEPLYSRGRSPFLYSCPRWGFGIVFITRKWAQRIVSWEIHTLSVRTKSVKL